MAEVKIHWSKEALQDLEDIITYISRDSEYYAKNFVYKIITSIEILNAFPEAGRVVPEHADKNLREILFRNYRIVYKVTENRIDVITIFRGSKQFID